MNRNYLRESDYVVHDAPSSFSVRPALVAALIIVLALFAAAKANAEAKFSTWSDTRATWEGNRSNSRIATGTSLSDCKAKVEALARSYGSSRTSGYNYYECAVVIRVDYVRPSAPTCTAPRPLAETRTATCPAPTIGTYGQKREYVSAAYPTCWVQGTTWQNVQEPSAVCQQPVPENRAPVISGTPSTAGIVGTQYNFQPTAADADGQPLTFSVTNRPAWATFSTTTGRLSGTPTAAATHSGILIGVSDGTATTSLPAFNLTVTAPAGTNSATLRWSPPNQNTDGTELRNLAGYKIYMRLNSDAVGAATPIVVNDSLIHTYTVNNLARGTWYFAMLAFNSQGAESNLTEVVHKVIP